MIKLMEVLRGGRQSIMIQPATGKRMGELHLDDDEIEESVKKEYIVWGIPPGKKDEEILFTKAKNMGEAKKVCDVLEKKHNCKKCRVQTLDLSTTPDFTNVFNEEKIDELSFTGQTLDQVRQDLFDFISAEHKKLGYTNPLDTYHLIQQVLDSNKIAGKVKGIR